MPSNPRWAVTLDRVEEGTLYALLVLLPFSKASVEITFAILLATWLVRRLVPPVRRPTVWAQPDFRPVLLAGLAFLGACALSVAASRFPRQSIEGLIEKWLEYVMFTVILADLGGRPRVVPRAMTSLAIAAVLVVCEAVWQELTGAGLLRRYPLGTYGRMTGPYENPIDLGTFFMVIAPALLAWWITLRGRARGWVGAVLAAVAICLGRTEALGAWLGLFAGLGLMAVKEPRIRRHGVTAAVLSAVLAVLWLAASGHLSSTFSLDDAGTVDRQAMWGAAAGMIADRPLIGHGVNTFMANYLDYWVGGEKVPRYAHNCYLQVAAETGLIGLAAFLALLGLAWRKIWRAMRPPLSDQGLWLLGLLAGMTTFLLQAGLDTNFYALRQAALFWSLTGLALGLAVRVRAAGR